jgi:hypothetical protein
MRLYNPSSTTFVKHFTSEVCITQNGDSIMDLFVAGYVNTTAAIDEIQFKTVLWRNTSGYNTSIWSIIMANYSAIKYNFNLPTGTTNGSGNSLELIKTLTADDSATNLTFVNGASDVVLDATYKTYLFKLINIHPKTDDTNFTVNFRDGGTNYDATKTSAAFQSLPY